MNLCGTCSRFYWNRLELFTLWPRCFLFQIQMSQRNFSQQIQIPMESEKEGLKLNSSKEVKKWFGNKLDVLTMILQHPPEAVCGLLQRTGGQFKLKGNEESISKTWTILQNYGYGLGAVSEYPKLLLITPASTENSILIMKESGFNTIRPKMIVKYKTMSTKTIGSLKQSHFIPEKLDVLKNYFKILNMPMKLEQETRNALVKHEKTVSKTLSLVEIRMFLLGHYLADRLEIPLDEMKSILMKNPRIRHRSFQWITQTLDILFKDFKFSKEKIIKHAYLLQCDPSRLIEIINKVPILGGKSIIEMSQSRPKILMSTGSTLYEIDQLFIKYGISTTAISKYPEMYTLSSKTIELRLEELNKIPQFITFKTHPRIARIIYYQNKIKKRLEILESMDVHGVSLHILSTDNERFNKFIQIGEMSNKGADMIHFIHNYLNIEKNQIRQHLLVHPNWLHVPVVNVKITLEYLKNIKKYTILQIINGLPIILYPINKIILAMEQIKQNNDAHENDEFYLQMVLYFLEKPVHFTGDGVWEKVICQEEDGEEKIKRNSVWYNIAAKRDNITSTGDSHVEEDIEEKSGLMNDVDEEEEEEEEEEDEEEEIDTDTGTTGAVCAETNIVPVQC